MLKELYKLTTFASSQSMSASNTMTVPGRELVDLEEIVKEYSLKFLDSDQKKQADLKNPIINWDFMTTTYGETIYRDQKSKEPKQHCLYTTTFRNNTSQAQSFSFTTERSTTAVSTVDYSKTICRGAEIQVSIFPPNLAVEASCGAYYEESKSKGASQSFEQTQDWKINNTIVVPSRMETKAEMTVKEIVTSWKFEQEITYEGRVLVSYEHRKTREHLITVSENVNKLFDPSKQTGFMLKGDKLTFVVKGTVTAKYGDHMGILLTETKLTKGSSL